VAGHCTPANSLCCLEHRDPPPGARKIGGTDEAVVSCTDDYRVIGLRHA
jgi:hypothetical protein